MSEQRANLPLGFKASPKAMEEALQRAVREAILEHKRAGRSIVVWRDGKVVWLAPEEIPDEPGPDTNSR